MLLTVTVVLVHASARAPHMCQKLEVVPCQIQRSPGVVTAKSDTPCKMSLKVHANDQFCQKSCLISGSKFLTLLKAEQCKQQHNHDL